MALCEVEEGDNGGLLVLGRIMRDDFLGTVEVFGCEFEGKLRTGWVSERQEEEERKKQTLGLLYGVSRCYRGWKG